MMHRHNSLFTGQYEDIEVVGFKSQFIFAYGNIDDEYFMKVEKGIGINPESKLEGIKKNNFFGTYVTGPILILNPLLTKKILTILGVENPKLALEEDCMEAYKVRLEEFKKVPFEK
jgi:CobQ-like glutamine amidotransferase family enzyme